MATDPLLPSIDYTSRDYLALRDDLIRIIRVRIPQWTADNPSDFGVALVEAYAYGLDTLHYYLDRVANEAYLSTAVQRESLYTIAEMFNYTPTAATAATVKLEFTNSSSKEVTVPAGARCSASISTGGGNVIKNFETIKEIKIAALPAGVDDPVPQPVDAIEGRTYKDETIGISTGFVRQQYILPRTSVLPYSTTVRTELKSGAASAETTIQEWSEVSDLQEANPMERVFQVYRQTDGSSQVRFGDGFHGAIPPIHAVIKADYRCGGGADGNVPLNSVKTLVEPVIYGVSVNNTDVGKGGSDPESLSSIRINAARSFRSRNRAVTAADYVALAETATGVAKAKALGSSGSSVTVYIVPNNDGTGHPDPSDDLLESTAQYLEERSMAGVTVVTAGPMWQDFYISLRIHVLASFKQDDVKAQVQAAIAARYGFDRVDFDGYITASDITQALSGIRGIDYPEVLGIDDVRPPAGAEDINNRPTTLRMSDISIRSIPYFNPNTSTGSLLLAMYGGISTSGGSS
jgi:uncharacterized phage protein gp47/JayE